MSGTMHELSALHFRNPDSTPLTARELEVMVITALGIMLGKGYEPFTPDQFLALLSDWTRKAADQELETNHA